MFIKDATKKKLRLIIVILIAGTLSLVKFDSAHADLDFNVPSPPQSSLLKSQPFRFGGRDIQVSVYTSQSDQENIIKYYKVFFENKGFQIVSDRQIQIANKRMLSFKKDILVVNIAILPKLGDTKVVIGKYLQPEGSPPIEELKPSLKDSMFALPKEDCEGEDLNIIPRPPESVRLSSSDTGSRAVLVYTTSLSVPEARDFYKLNMPYQGWEIKQEMAAADGLNAYKRTTGKSSLGVKAPLEGFNAEQIISDSYLLEFYGRFGRADITILPNFINRESGSMVQIVYEGPR